MLLFLTFFGRISFGALGLESRQVFAPNSPYRSEITLQAAVKKAFQFKEETSDGKFPNHTWSRMLARTFKIDVTTCEKCGGKLQAICAVKDPDSIRRYLSYLQLA